MARILQWFAILEWITFIRSLHYDPVCLGWPCTSWLIALLSYSRTFTSTTQWSMKGIIPRYYTVTILIDNTKFSSKKIVSIYTPMEQCICLASSNFIITGIYQLNYFFQLEGNINICLICFSLIPSLNVHFLCLLNIFFFWYYKLPVYILCNGYIPVTEHFISAAFDIVNIPVLWILFLKFILNWRIIALQCCVHSAIQQSESAMSIHLPPPSWNSFPYPIPFYPSRLCEYGVEPLCYIAASH